MSQMRQLMPIGQVDAAIERLAREHDAMAKTLMEVEEHICRQLLESVPLTGLTQERWTRASNLVAALWVDFGTHRAVLERVRSARARRAWPTRADLRELSELLTGAVVTSNGCDVGQLPSSLTGSTRGTAGVCVRQLVAKMKAAYAEVSDVLRAVDEVWTALPPRIQRCHERLSAAHASAFDLGMAPGRDPVADSVTAARRDLEALSIRVHTDPLALCTGGRVDYSAVDHLDREAERARADLEPIEKLREQAQERLDRLLALLGHVSDCLHQACEERREAVEKIHGLVLAPVPTLDDALRVSLESAARLRQAGQWRRLSTVLDDVERRLEVERRNAERILASVRRPLEHRAELRGRLRAYRAKARRLGRAENVELENQYERARGLLRSIPCDLEAAAAAVTSYQGSVNHGTERRRRGDVG